MHIHLQPPKALHKVQKESPKTGVPVSPVHENNENTQSMLNGFACMNACTVHPCVNPSTLSVSKFGSCPIQQKAITHRYRGTHTHVHGCVYAHAHNTACRCRSYASRYRNCHSMHWTHTCKLYHVLYTCEHAHAACPLDSNTTCRRHQLWASVHKCVPAWLLLCTTRLSLP